jgi:hypothetical protein
VPRRMLMGRWVLTVDADEFLVLPPPFATVEELAAKLDEAGLASARALMLDFFPERLRDIEGAALQADPFELCPSFDAYSSVNWPSDTYEPDVDYLAESVRPRMLAQLKARGVPLGDLMDQYKHASLHKVPLVKWTEPTRMLTSHRPDKPASDRVQMALAHFKFYPGYAARIAGALSTQAYYLQSSEYRFLDIATRELSDWPLAGPQSRQFRSAQDLVDAGLIYSRI